MARKKRNEPPAVAPRRTIYPGGIVQCERVIGEDGEPRVAFVFHEPGHTHIFPMPAEYAERVAGDMTGIAIRIQTGEPDAQTA